MCPPVILPPGGRPAVTVSRPSPWRTMADRRRDDESRSVVDAAAMGSQVAIRERSDGPDLARGLDGAGAQRSHEGNGVVRCLALMDQVAGEQGSRPSEPGPTVDGYSSSSRDAPGDRRYSFLELPRRRRGEVPDGEMDRRETEPIEYVRVMGTTVEVDDDRDARPCQAVEISRGPRVRASQYLSRDPCAVVFTSPDQWPDSSQLHAWLSFPGPLDAERSRKPTTPAPDRPGRA